MQLTYTVNFLVRATPEDLSAPTSEECLPDAAAKLQSVVGNANETREILGPRRRYFLRVRARVRGKAAGMHAHSDPDIPLADEVNTCRRCS